MKSLPGFIYAILICVVLTTPVLAANSPNPGGGDDSSGEGPWIFNPVDSFGFVNDDNSTTDSIPWLWDFLVFGTINLDSGFSGGTMAAGTNGLVYAGPGHVGQTGYGGGFGPEVWIQPAFAVRVLLQGSVYMNGLNASTTSTGLNLAITNKPFFAFAAASIGPVFKLFGTQNYFLYAPIDLGYALTITSIGSPAVVGAPSKLSSVTGGSIYADTGIGVNLRFLMIELKAAWLPTPNQFGYGGDDFFFPLTIGFDL